jgi:hypothetical protein
MRAESALKIIKERDEDLAKDRPERYSFPLSLTREYR